MKKVCEVCGKEFDAGSAAAKYCSIECRSKSPAIQAHVGEEWNELKIQAARWDGKRIIVKCLCSCGKEFECRYDSVVKGSTPSCGHLTHYKEKGIDLSGTTRGKITAVKKIRGSGYNAVYEVHCECGNICEMTGKNFKCSTSCGCVRTEKNIKNVKQALEDYCVEGTDVQKILPGKKPGKANTSGIVGVSWDRERSRWCAQITFKGKNYHLGRYYTLKEATDARKTAEEKLFGDFLGWYKQEYPERWEKLKKGKKTVPGE